MNTTICWVLWVLLANHWAWGSLGDPWHTDQAKSLKVTFRASFLLLIRMLWPYLLNTSQITLSSLISLSLFDSDLNHILTIYWNICLCACLQCLPIPVCSVQCPLVMFVYVCMCVFVCVDKFIFMLLVWPHHLLDLKSFKALYCLRNNVNLADS